MRQGSGEGPSQGQGGAARTGALLGNSSLPGAQGLPSYPHGQGGSGTRGHAQQTPRSPSRRSGEVTRMAGARHPVCVSGAALVQTDRLQVGAHGTPASPRGGGGAPGPAPPRRPQPPPAGVRLLRVLVRWQRQLRAQKLGGLQETPRESATRLPQQPDPRETTHTLPLCPLRLSAKGPLPALPGEPSGPSETNDASSRSENPQGDLPGGGRPAAEI